MKYTKNHMNHRFLKRVNELILSKQQNHKMFSKVHYAEMIQKVKISKNNENKKPEDYQRLKRFDVIEDGNLEKLISPPKHGKPGKIYVHIDELFEVLYESHIAIGHGAKNKMERTLCAKYKNITKDMITIYLQLCKTCDRKNRAAAAKRAVQENSMVTTEMNSRGQIDLIDMQVQPDGDYKFILVYRDHVTKFVQMRPLLSDRIRDITMALLDVFTIFGAPNILQSERGRAFASDIIQDMSGLWPQLKMVHGSLRNSHFHGERRSHEIRGMLRSWMSENNSQKWTEGIRFIQLMMNGTHNARMNCSPYEAMFGTSIKLGLPSELADTVPGQMVSEEQFRAFLNN